LKYRVFVQFSAALFLNIAAYSHGTKFTVIQPKEIRIQAAFDTGEPMADAEVLLFPPNETRESSSVHTDSNGVFTFIPDRPGVWVCQVRHKSGHGMRINSDINENLSLSSHSRISGVSQTQKIIMAICVIWGMIGTALFFKNK